MSPRSIVVAAVLVAVSLAFDLLIGADPPGYAAAVGLGACLGLTLLAKGILRRVIQRRADYWDQERARRG